MKFNTNSAITKSSQAQRIYDSIDRLLSPVRSIFHRVSTKLRLRLLIVEVLTDPLSSTPATQSYGSNFPRVPLTFWIDSTCDHYRLQASLRWSRQVLWHIIEGVRFHRATPTANELCELGNKSGWASTRLRGLIGCYRFLPSFTGYFYRHWGRRRGNIGPPVGKGRLKQRWLRHAPFQVFIERCGWDERSILIPHLHTYTHTHSHTYTQKCTSNATSMISSPETTPSASETSISPGLFIHFCCTISCCCNQCELGLTKMDSYRILLGLRRTWAAFIGGRADREWMRRQLWLLLMEFMWSGRSYVIVLVRAVAIAVFEKDVAFVGAVAGTVADRCSAPRRWLNRRLHNSEAHAKASKTAST